jgi:hypothetical protein
MKLIRFLSLAVAGIALIGSGCGMSDFRAQWAHDRCERVLAQARLEAVQELMAAGQTEQAQQVLSRYLPEAALPMSSTPLLAAEDDGKEETPSQYARLNLESELEAQNQTW